MAYHNSFIHEPSIDQSSLESLSRTLLCSRSAYAIDGLDDEAQRFYTEQAGRITAASSCTCRTGRFQPLTLEADFDVRSQYCGSDKEGIRGATLSIVFVICR